jgi:hypothetical protein
MGDPPVEGVPRRTVAAREFPAVRKIVVDDLVEAFASGLRDFRAAPAYGLAIGAFCAGGGWLIVLLLWQFKMPYLAYPMAMGFVLVAPFVVTGLYDVSRRLELSEPVSWSAMAGAIWATRLRDLRWMALISAFSLVIWMDIAALLSFGFLGFKSLDGELLNELLTTPSGLLFLLIGNLAGALIALFRVFDLGGVVSAAVRSRRRFRHRYRHQRQDGHGEPADDGDLVRGDRDTGRDLDPVGIRRTARAVTGARSCLVASLPARGGAIAGGRITPPAFHRRWRGWPRSSRARSSSAGRNWVLPPRSRWR